MCARAGLERLQASRDAVNAERAEAVPNRLSADLQGVHLPEANQATSQGARERDSRKRTRKCVILIWSGHTKW
ncbi:MAG: hypothetical protein V2G44_00155 [bacterium JZ-2024 1]